MSEDAVEDRRRKLVQRAIKRGSFCTLATSSQANRPHVVGVLYAVVDRSMYVSTLESSVKARNVRANPRVAVCIPVRRFPVGPPFHVAFQGRAELCTREDARIARLLDTRRLAAITSHGELDDPESCFLVISPGRRVATYGLGVPVRQLVRDPLHGSFSLEVF